MPANLTPFLILDSRGEILQALQFDAAATIEDIAASFEPTLYNMTIGNAVDLLVPQTESARDQFKAKAFRCSALVVAAAFEQANVDDEARQLVQKGLLLGTVPSTLLMGSTESRLAVFQGLATRAYANHREMSEAGGMVLNYFVETSQDSTMGRYAMCGLGFMLHQLDRSWERARVALIRKELDIVDWDELFK